MFSSSWPGRARPLAKFFWSTEPFEVEVVAADVHVVVLEHRGQRVEALGRRVGAGSKQLPW
jgi:hypothetical protein